MRTPISFVSLLALCGACADDPAPNQANQQAANADANGSITPTAPDTSGEPEPSSSDAGSEADADANASVMPKSVRCTPGDASALTLERLSQAGRFAFATKDLALEDKTRKTPKNGDAAELSSRLLPTTVWYPADGSALSFGDRPVAKGGPFPLVIYAHGFNLNSDAGQYLGEHLASHGFIVAALDFPLSQQNANGGPTFDDLANQPGDLSFVIDEMLARAESQGDLFAGAVDREHIAIVGYSLGGTTAMLAGYHPLLRDDRVDAVVSLAGIHAMFSGDFFRARALPALVMHGDLDAIIPYEPNARTALVNGAPNVHLGSVAKGTHVGFASLPLEPVVVGIGSLIAPQGSDPNNPDGLGCGTVGNLVPRDNAYLSALGGVVMGIVDPTPLDPCKLDELGKPAIAPADQRDKTRPLVLSFLRAYLSDERDVSDAYCGFFESSLKALPGLTIE